MTEVEDPWANVPPPFEEPGLLNGHAPIDTPRQRPPMRLLGRDDLANLPEPVPLIDDTLDQGTVFVLLGYHQTLKSFVAQSWCASVATGFAWHDRPVSEARRVLYVAAEGLHGLHNRLTAWERWQNTRISHESLMTYPSAVNLAHPPAVADLVALVRGEGFGMIVLDTFAKCAVGLDENSARDMGQVVDSLYRIREAAGHTGVVGVVHHTGKADRATARGSSALESGVDTVYTTEGDSRAMTLTRTKRKDGPANDRLALGFRGIEGTRSGVAVTQLDGSTSNLPGVDEVVTIVLGTMHGGLTSAEVARQMTGSKRPSRATVEQTRRRLDAAVGAGVLGYTPPSAPGMAGVYHRGSRDQDH
jgi:hypothetical protein